MSTRKKGANDFGLTRVPVSLGIANKARTFLFQTEAETEAACIPKIRQPPERCDWRKLWFEIARAFRHEADCLIKNGNPAPHDIAPQIAREWLELALDKFARSWLRKERKRCHFWLHQDIGTWAYLFATRELSFRHPELDEDRIERGELSVVACKFLTGRFYAFACARRNFHALLLARFLKLNGYSKGATWERLKELLSGKTVRGNWGRPRKIKWPHDQRDLWLVLAEPVAWLNRWTYADFLRAERVFFGDGKPPLDRSGLSSFKARLDSRDAARESFFFGRSQEEIDWSERQLNVPKPDAKAMQSRCKGLGIQLRGEKRRANEKEPPMLMTIFKMPTIAPQKVAFGVSGAAERRNSIPRKQT